MGLASLLHQYQPELKSKYTDRLLPGHLRAMRALQRCRTPDAGQIQLQCTDCAETQSQPHSCGHRSCPKCQNHEASLWLDRQRTKLLPVEYFMVTFTLPRELRSLAWCNQTLIYNILFAVACSTLKDFGLNPKHLGAEIGMTAVLHTPLSPFGLSPAFACHRTWRRCGSGKAAMEKEKGQIPVQ